MKSLIVVVVILSIAYCGFDLTGSYGISGECNAYMCPNTQTV